MTQFVLGERMYSSLSKTLLIEQFPIDKCKPKKKEEKKKIKCNLKITQLKLKFQNILQELFEFTHQVEALRDNSIDKD
jgi:hypothetical protein